jgi:hypothetical protein
VRLDLSAELPARIVGDARAGQILSNLIDNAVKFTAGSCRWRRCPARRRRPPHAGVSVTDSGIGIPLDKQIVVFEKCRQADSSTTRRAAAPASASPSAVSWRAHGRRHRPRGTRARARPSGSRFRWLRPGDRPTGGRRAGAGRSIPHGRRGALLVEDNRPTVRGPALHREAGAWWTWRPTAPRRSSDRRPD